MAKVAACQNSAYPAEILNYKRIVQPMQFAVLFGSRFRSRNRRVALGNHVRANKIAIITGRCVDDDKCNHAHRKKNWYGLQ